MPSRLAREEMRRASLGRPVAVALGKFDGVHLGHQALVRSLQSQARERGLASGVVIFHPNPLTVLRPGTRALYLTSLDERIELLYQLGLDTVAPVTFTSELAQSSAEEFARSLREDLQMALLVAGPDLAIGRGREGIPARMQELGNQLGFEVCILPFESLAGAKIGSGAVRGALAQGDMPEVARLLGRPFSLSGPVVTGAKRGRSIGFPTANIGVGADRELPCFGVYATRAHVGERIYASVTNIGLRPTFNDGPPSVETFIFDFDGDIYGQEIRIDLVTMLRGEEKFENIEALKAQIASDAEAARLVLQREP
ncbi:MAG TPA: riboflavin biosynthesis protein RibF [Dehalococcoidia bacterium]|nr:riboflavin biosynthesis protein RibF [Dehalococcoidia bacterium]